MASWTDIPIEKIQKYWALYTILALCYVITVVVARNDTLQKEKDALHDKLLNDKEEQLRFFQVISAHSSPVVIRDTIYFDSSNTYGRK